MSEQELREQLKSCEAHLRRIKEDRDHLRDASNDFADLAERLGEQIRELRQRIDELEKKRAPSGG